MVLRLKRGNGGRALGPRGAFAYCGKKRYRQPEDSICRLLETALNCLTLNQLNPMEDWHGKCVL